MRGLGGHVDVVQGLAPARRVFLTVEVTDPHGNVQLDRRPGHSLSGLFYYMDPFQAPYSIRLGRVNAWLNRTAKE